MFFILSKLIHWLLSPLVWAILLLIASFVIRSNNTRKALRGLSLGILLFFTNPLIAKWMMNIWEVKSKEYQTIAEAYDYGIVLAGITEPNRPPFDRIHFNKGADRIVHAIELYKLGKLKKILIIGGSGVLTFEGKKESHALADFAILCGVPPQDVMIEDQSRNTHENAAFSSVLIPNNSQCLLFTSAFHMKRAEGCFHKTGLLVDTFPTDYYGGPIHFSPDDLFIPKIYSLQLWSILLKEWVGIVSYKIAGYL
ncbi:YdcF family protein [Reichenbachiella ulvae]|uniref:YdcF family protein n=1 Tax=Reichenbachiella ulvae TaxID=2980104 RepID=A0ABT3CPE7_9BACT|nr:YdcF family protein [Reichenbachiella ulvae]MCV9385585.1 YdcF family protein [Reichenbachiella ulvae]